ncbi:hypothetical protein KQX54_012390 [Cotesia glomerata]|uniref:Uncharacterized protein n=1 Tax=Cotesia glomerata TaxID=32391 RepID=A0AAV7I5J1_COTGL|nr:hypothetical protein KQX54_012390 [Cotesia glomerata]
MRGSLAPLYARILVPDNLSAMGIRYYHEARDIIDTLDEPRPSTSQTLDFESKESKSSEDSTKYSDQIKPATVESKSSEGSSKKSEVIENPSSPTNNREQSSRRIQRTFPPIFIPNPPTYEQLEDMMREKPYRYEDALDPSHS